MKLFQLNISVAAQYSTYAWLVCSSAAMSAAEVTNDTMTVSSDKSPRNNASILRREKQVSVRLKILIWFTSLLSFGFELRKYTEHTEPVQSTKVEILPIKGYLASQCLTKGLLWSFCTCQGQVRYDYKQRYERLFILHWHVLSTAKHFLANQSLHPKDEGKGGVDDQWSHQINNLLDPKPAGRLVLSAAHVGPAH